MYINTHSTAAKKYKAGISPPVRRLSRQATVGSRGGVVTVSHLRHRSPGRVWVMCQRGGRCSQHPQHHVSRGVADHEGSPAFTPTQQPPTCRLGGGSRAGPQGGGYSTDKHSFKGKIIPRWNGTLLKGGGEGAEQGGGGGGRGFTVQ
ncbi:hypothetical protein GWK47_009423 [Chionoecetes opilio]|uniref:Uncharacterized protein n=1 Tax=Chionoecetes opilio TaxID=41210 RepID=A0A8J5CN71_CHIOP|nr:hypothetical protein GWK47_009423 [Chionoecetes opilio]